MFHFFRQTINRILFALNFIIAVQLPAFIQQYAQRLAGHLDEARLQLGNYQFIADQHYQGNLADLIRQYQSNSDPSIKAIGDLVHQLLSRTTELEHKVNHLLHSDYLDRIYYFFIEIDINVVRSVIPTFQLAIPLETQALATGIIFAVCLSIFAQISGHYFSKFFNLNT